MNKSTKQLFNAPLRAEEYKHGKGAFIVRNNGGYLVAENMSGQDANRLTHLPELYEELKSSSYDFCWSCLATLGIDPPTADELIENLCPRKPNCCGYNKRWELLRKVRNGE